MSGSRFHELVSDLTEALRPNGTGTKGKEGLSSRTGKQAKDSGPSEPQTIIYTRKSYGQFKTTFISENVMSQLGYEPSDFIENESFWTNRIHPEDAQKVLSGLSKLCESGRVVHEYRFLHNDGTYRWMRDELNRVDDNDGASSEILGSWTDITDRKRFDQALRESETRYRSLVENSPVGMISFDKTGEITEFNSAVLTMLGAAMAGSTEARDLYSLLPMVEAGISEAILKCMKTSESGVGEFLFKSKTDRDLHTRVHVVPVNNGDDSVTGTHVFVLDISDQKRAEELVIRSERLKALGQISSGVGHEFNNLLQVVSGNVNMALTNLELKDYKGLRNNLNQILKGTETATETVRCIQQFGGEASSGVAPQEEVFDLTDAVEEAVEMCKLWSKVDLEKKNIRITHELDLTSNCYILGQPDQIVWVTLNLLKNAVEAMPDGGKIRVKTRIDANRVTLTVRDYGISIPDRHIGQIAKAFWTSKEGHAGMGLAFNSEIVRKHGGTMGFKRMKPEGTSFVIRLPYVDDPAQKPVSKPDTLADRGFRILFVDDEDLVVRMFETGLTMLGQTVLPASSGPEALKMFEATKIDAVVSDLAMPEMNGWELAAAIEESCRKRGVPKPPFIILTGLENPSDQKLAEHPAVDRLARKPLAVPKLLDLIVEVSGQATDEGTISGHFEGVELLEYLQLLLLNNATTAVEVISRNGVKGFVFVDKGKISHAICEDLQGESALYKCLTFEAGSFSSQPWQGPKTATIDKPGQFLLIEAARKRDDMRHDVDNKDVIQKAR